MVSSHRLKLFDTRFAENLLVALETLKKKTEEHDSMKSLECEKLFNQTQILQFLPASMVECKCDVISKTFGFLFYFQIFTIYYIKTPIGMFQ